MRANSSRVRGSMTIHSNSTVSLGKFLISPLVRVTDDGAFAASVSIRSGRGSGTHDRVVRLTGRFPSHESARCHALAQGYDFIRPRLAASVIPPSPFQAGE
jgi:hypothetical protein